MCSSIALRQLYCFWFQRERRVSLQSTALNHIGIPFISKTCSAPFVELFSILNWTLEGRIHSVPLGSSLSSYLLCPTPLLSSVKLMLSKLKCSFHLWEKPCSQSNSRIDVLLKCSISRICAMYSAGSGEHLILLVSLL